MKGFTEKLVKAKPKSGAKRNAQKKSEPQRPTTLDAAGFETGSRQTGKVSFPVAQS